jgi:SAM-dependent methyltransferase
MSFGAIADDYDRLRPGPPDAAVDWLLPAHCDVAVDLGAGTGLLTRQLARRVARVVAIEPDERMGAVLRARSPGLEVIQGKAEAIPLPDASADGVFVSSAWHWMDPDLAVPEIGRVLRDGGRFGVIWAGRDHQSGWLREIGGLRVPATADSHDQGTADSHGQGTADSHDYTADSHDQGTADSHDQGTADSHDQGTADSHGQGTADPDGQGTADSRGQGTDRPRSRHHDVTLPVTGLFTNMETASFGFTRAMTISGIVEMLATYSGLITASPEDRAAALDRARTALMQRFDGASEIDVPMRASCWRADRTNRTYQAD